MGDGIRLFIGVPVAASVAGELAGTCESLARRATAQKVAMRWLAPASYHVTLRYLGWTRRETVSAVERAIIAVCSCADEQQQLYQPGVQGGSSGRLARAGGRWNGRAGRSASGDRLGAFGSVGADADIAACSSLGDDCDVVVDA